MFEKKSTTFLEVEYCLAKLEPTIEVDWSYKAQSTYVAAYPKIKRNIKETYHYWTLPNVKTKQKFPNIASYNLGWTTSPAGQMYICKQPDTVRHMNSFYHGSVVFMQTSFVKAIIVLPSEIYRE